MWSGELGRNAAKALTMKTRVKKHNTCASGVRCSICAVPSFSVLFFSVLFLFVCHHACVSDVAAEDRKPMEFYPRNFARSDGATGQGSERLSTDSPAPRRTKQGDLTSKDVGETGPRPGASDQEVALTVEKKDEPQKVPHLELYVNSKDPDHLNQVVETTLRLLKERRISLSIIFHIGHYGTLSRQNRAALDRLNIVYSQVTGVPYGVEITRSPVWVFSPGHDSRIVEGYLSPEKFLATNGAEPPKATLESNQSSQGELEGL